VRTLPSRLMFAFFVCKGHEVVYLSCYDFHVFGWKSPYLFLGKAKGLRWSLLSVARRIKPTERAKYIHTG
jgi:hypothetical protein